MKKITLIVIISLFSIFVLLVAGIYFYASTQISPEMVRKIALEQLKKTFPKARIELGKVDISFGLSVELHLDQLKMQLPMAKKEYQLASVKNISAKVPIWAILTGGGTVEMAVRNPAFGYYEIQGQNNWTLAMRGSAKKTMPAKTTTKSSKKKGKVEDQSFSIPSLASRIRLNIDVRNVDLSYGLKDGSGGAVRLEKFLVKDLNFERPTAFELLSNIDATPMEGQNASMEVLVIGELNLGELIETSEITCKIMVQASKIKLSNFPGDMPEIKTDVVVKVDKKGHLSGETHTLFSSRNKISTHFAISPTKMSIADLKVELFPADLMKIVNFDDKMLDADKAKLVVEGKVDMVGTLLKPSLNFAMNPGISFKYKTVAGSSTMKGFFKGKSFSMISNTSVLNGNIDFEVRHDSIDLNDKRFDFFKLKPFLISLRVENLKAEKKQLQELIYSADGLKKAGVSSGSGEEQVASSTTVKPSTNSFASLLLPAANVAVKCSRNMIGKSEFGCDGKIKISSKRVVTESLKFNFSEGQGKVTHSSNIAAAGIMSRFSFDLKNLDMVSLSAVLPPMVDSFQGTAKGSAKGAVNYFANGNLEYDVDVNTRLTDGEIKGIDLAGKLNSVLSGLAKLPKVGKELEKIDKLQIGDNFETLELVGRFRHTRYDFKKVSFVGLHKKIKIQLTPKGKAYLFPPPLKKEGFMDIDFVESYNLVCNRLEKFSGTKIIPIRLKGEEFILMPDVGYTISKLGQKVATGVAKKEARKVIEKQVDKKLKGKAGKEVKKLFKKFKF